MLIATSFIVGVALSALALSQLSNLHSFPGLNTLGNKLLYTGMGLIGISGIMACKQYAQKKAATFRIAYLDGEHNEEQLRTLRTFMDLDIICLRHEKTEFVQWKDRKFESATDEEGFFVFRNRKTRQRVQVAFNLDNITIADCTLIYRGATDIQTEGNIKIKDVSRRGESGIIHEVTIK